jgi:hypothetical protein
VPSQHTLKLSPTAVSSAVIRFGRGIDHVPQFILGVKNGVAVTLIPYMSEWLSV